MKIPLFAILTLLPCLAVAQSTPPATSTAPSDTETHHHHHHFSPDQQLAFLTTKLGLSATQQAQIKPVLVSTGSQIKTIHDNASLTKEQKHAEIKPLEKSSKTQIEQYLNPAQLAEFKQLHHHHDHA
jgi:molecular chaperone DnaK (HSP70)